jgi:hypothetical protein
VLLIPSSLGLSLDSQDIEELLMAKDVESSSYSSLRAKGLLNSIINIHEERIRETKETKKEQLLFVRISLTVGFVTIFVGFTINAFCEPLFLTSNHFWYESTGIVFVDLLIMIASAFGFNTCIWSPKRSKVKWNLWIQVTFFVLMSVSAFSVSYTTVIKDDFQATDLSKDSTKLISTISKFNNSTVKAVNRLFYSDTNAIECSNGTLTINYSTVSLPKGWDIYSKVGNENVKFFSLREDRGYLVPEKFGYIVIIVCSLYFAFVCTLGYFLWSLEDLRYLVTAEKETIQRLKSNLETPTELDKSESSFSTIEESDTSETDMNKKLKINEIKAKAIPQKQPTEQKENPTLLVKTGQKEIPKKSVETRKIHKR